MKVRLPLVQSRVDDGVRVGVTHVGPDERLVPERRGRELLLERVLAHDLQRQQPAVTTRLAADVDRAHAAARQARRDFVRTDAKRLWHRGIRRRGRADVDVGRVGRHPRRRAAAARDDDHRLLPLRGGAQRTDDGPDEGRAVRGRAPARSGRTADRHRPAAPRGRPSTAARARSSSGRRRPRRSRARTRGCESSRCRGRCRALVGGGPPARALPIWSAAASSFAARSPVWSPAGSSARASAPASSAREGASPSGKGTRERGGEALSTGRRLYASRAKGAECPLLL